MIRVSSRAHNSIGLDTFKALGYNCLRIPFLYDMIMDGTNFVEAGWTNVSVR